MQGLREPTFSILAPYHSISTVRESHPEALPKRFEELGRQRLHGVDEIRAVRLVPKREQRAELHNFPESTKNHISQNPICLAQSRVLSSFSPLAPARGFFVRGICRIERPVCRADGMPAGSQSPGRRPLDLRAEAGRISA